MLHFCPTVTLQKSSFDSANVIIYVSLIGYLIRTQETRAPTEGRDWEALTRCNLVILWTFGRHF